MDGEFQMFQPCRIVGGDAPQGHLYGFQPLAMLFKVVSFLTLLHIGDPVNPVGTDFSGGRIVCHQMLPPALYADENFQGKHPVVKYRACGMNCGLECDPAMGGNGIQKLAQNLRIHGMGDVVMLEPEGNLLLAG